MAEFLVAPASTGIALFIGVFAGVIAIWGVATQRSIARRRATLDHIAKSESDGDVIRARRKFIELAKAEGGLATWAEPNKEPSEEVQAIRIVLNEFELIAICIQRGIIDYELYRRWNRSGTIKYWTHAAPFVHHLRSRLENELIYHEFEEMVRWMKGESIPRRGRWLGLWF